MSWAPTQAPFGLGQEPEGTPYLPLGYIAGPVETFEGGWKRSLVPLYVIDHYEGSARGALFLVWLGIVALAAIAWRKLRAPFTALVLAAVLIGAVPAPASAAISGFHYSLFMAPGAPFAANRVAARPRPTATPKPRPSPVRVLGVVMSVADGDTFTFQVGATGAMEKVRLVGIDAPEKTQPRWGIAARERLSRLVLNRPIQVEPVSATRPRDLYGRLLGWVYAGNINVNRTMIAEGLALARNFGTKILDFDMLIIAQASAQAAAAGVWADPTFVEPAQFRKERGIGIRH